MCIVTNRSTMPKKPHDIDEREILTSDLDQNRAAINYDFLKRMKRGNPVYNDDYDMNVQQSIAEGTYNAISNMQGEDPQFNKQYPQVHGAEPIRFTEDGNPVYPDNIDTLSNSLNNPIRTESFQNLRKLLSK